MRITKKIVATGLVATAMTAGALATTATPASAAVHRGSAGCINWSWGDGTISWTIYASNTCSTTAHLKWTVLDGGAVGCMNLSAKSKEHHKYGYKPDNTSFKKVSICPPGTGD